MIGNKIYNFAKKLWKINRSITGKGLRETLNHIKKDYLKNLKIHSLPSGKKVFDWIIPDEWDVDEAYIVTPDNKKICDISNNNLHLVGYSVPFKGTLMLKNLQKHLYSIPDKPYAIPYVTSYYKKRWGFCIEDSQRKKLKNGKYKIIINSKHYDGFLNYGELILPGKSKKQILLSTYVCHPSMANNELSGPTVTTFLAIWLSKFPNRFYTYRILLVPETIGSIAFLSKNYKNLKKNVVGGFNVSCVGDERTYSFLPSRNGNTISDKIANHTLKWIDQKYKKYSWLDRGSDERQYCAPGIDLPIASIMRSKYVKYYEYHTSLDDLKKVVTLRGLEGGYDAIVKALEIFEKNKYYKTNILCEPQLSRRKLYPDISSHENNKKTKLLMNIISFCDGNHSLLDIAEILNSPCWKLYETINILIKKKIIHEVKKN